MSRATRSFTAEDAFSHRALGGVTVTPDGRRAAFAVAHADLDANEQRSAVWLWDDEEGIRPVTHEGYAHSPAFSPSGRRLGFVSDRAGKAAQVYVMDGTLCEGRPVTSLQRGAVRFEWGPRGERLAVLARSDPEARENEDREQKRDWRVCDADEPRRSLFVVRADGSGKARRISADDEHVSSAAWTPDGRHLAYVACPIGTIDSQWFGSELKLMDAAGRGRRTVCRVIGHSVEGPISVSPDGASALLCCAAGPGDLFNVSARVVDLQMGRKRLLAPGFDRWSLNPQWLPDGRVLFQAGMGTSQRLFACRPGGGPQPLDAGPGVAGQPAVAGEAGHAFCAYSESDRPDELYRIPLDGGEPERLTDLNAGMAGLKLSPMEVVRWRSPDGLEVEGLLFRPTKPRARRPWPLVVIPHGGPYSVSMNNYDRAVTAHMFCAAGYACLLPNFRGSTGYGAEFLRRAVGDWGDGPFADVMSGVDALIRRGMADRSRLAIFGGSYGGYMTAWAVGHTRRFRAAVAWAPVTNNLSMYGTTDVPSFMLGSSASRRPDPAGEFWAAQSPLSYAHRVRTPTLILAGEADVRVPPGQSQEFYRALKAAGVETKLILYPREPHGINEPRHRLHFLQQSLAWIAERV
jgi:dipeptidyl aminopeptidase/acylaminoacyl peptidase